MAIARWPSLDLARSFGQPLRVEAPALWKLLRTDGELIAKAIGDEQKELEGPDPHDPRTAAWAGATRLSSVSVWRSVRRSNASSARRATTRHDTAPGTTEASPDQANPEQ
jgi:hypothetical protein